MLLVKDGKGHSLRRFRVRTILDGSSSIVTKRTNDFFDTYDSSPFGSDGRLTAPRGSRPWTTEDGTVGGGLWRTVLASRLLSRGTRQRRERRQHAKTKKRISNLAFTKPFAQPSNPTPGRTFGHCRLDAAFRMSGYANRCQPAYASSCSIFDSTNQSHTEVILPLQFDKSLLRDLQRGPQWGQLRSARAQVGLELPVTNEGPILIQRRKLVLSQ